MAGGCHFTFVPRRFITFGVPDFSGVVDRRLAVLGGIAKLIGDTGYLQWPALSSLASSVLARFGGEPLDPLSTCRIQSSSVD